MQPEESTNRPRRSRLRRVIARIALALAVVLGITLTVYAVLAIRFYSQSPRPARNFAAELNAPLLEIPEEERAWPVYRAILLKRREIPADFWISEEYISSESPREEVEARKLHELNHHLLADVREASKIPRLGFLLRDEIDPLDYAWYNPFGFERGIKPDVASENPPLGAVHLLHIPELREFARQLADEAIRAAADGDAPLAVENVLAMLRIAEQLRETRFAVVASRSFEIAERAIVVFGQLLAERPQQFTIQDLDRVAAQVAGFAGGGALRPRFEFDRLTVEDVVQRVYTDDGRGDGMLVEFELQSYLPDAPGASGGWGKLLAPITTYRYASRSEALRTFNEFMDRAETECRRPLWDWSDREFQERIAALDGQSPRYMPVTFLTRRISVFYLPAERLIQRRDALLAAIALERFRRERGSWPHALSELVPSHLPNAPTDRFDGRPLRYRVIDGHPLLYSVGADRDDDNGLGHLAAGAWLSDPDGNRSIDAPNGDWILWPSPDEELRSLEVE